MVVKKRSRAPKPVKKAIQKKRRVLEDQKPKHVYFGGRLTKWKERFYSKDLILVEMSHMNGSVSHLVIRKQDHKFKYANKVYIVDENVKQWNNSTKMYMFRYHEGFALPYANTITTQDLKDTLPDHQSINEVSTSYNPFVLVDVLKMEYAKGVIQGGEVSKTIKQILFIVILVGLIALGHLLINALQSGWI